MTNRPTIALARSLLLALALLTAHGSGLAHAQSTPAPATSDAMVLQCDGVDPLCEGDGAMAEYLAKGESSDTEMAWSLVRVTLQPGASVQPGDGHLPTHYSVYVEEGSVGLTASVPVTCIGECHVEDQAEAATPDAGSTGAVRVSAGTEVILSPGDVATFGHTSDSGHVYRNAGNTEAQFISSMVAHVVPDQRCRGRCLDGF